MRSLVILVGRGGEGTAWVLLVPVHIFVSNVAAAVGARDGDLLPEGV